MGPHAVVPPRKRPPPLGGSRRPRPIPPSVAAGDSIQGAARTSAGPAVRVGRGRATHPSSAQGPAPARAADGGGRPGPVSAGLGIGRPSRWTAAVPRVRHARRLARPRHARPPAGQSRPAPFARRAARPLTGGSTAALALPPAPNDERRPPPAAWTATSGVTRLPLSRAGSLCACASRGRGAVRPPFCCGPRGRVPRGLTASRLSRSVRSLCLPDEGLLFQSGFARPLWLPGLPGLGLVLLSLESRAAPCLPESHVFAFFPPRDRVSRCSPAWCGLAL